MKAKYKVLLIVFFALFSLNSCQVGRFIVYNFADVNDHKKFPAREIEAAPETFQFEKASNASFPKTYKNDSTGVEMPFDEYLIKQETLAFLIIKNDSIQYQRYFEGYNQNSVVPSFSMAKSVISMLIGIAIEEQRIGSVNDSIGNYIDGLKHKNLQNTTIEDLLQMTSGLDYNESYYSPFADAAAFYYGRNLDKKTKRLKIDTNAKGSFEYTSGSTQLLAMVLDNVLEEESISHYFQRKIWQPIGAKYATSWSLDKKAGMEKAFCCINATAIDYAKLGRLYLKKGKFKNKQIVPQDWVEKSVKVDTSNGSAANYQYQWWLPTPNGDFVMRGFLGQYVYVNPEKELIMVRLGKTTGDIDWLKALPYLANKY